MAFLSVTQTVTLNHGANKQLMEKRIMCNVLNSFFSVPIKFMIFSFLVFRRKLLLLIKPSEHGHLFSILTHSSICYCQMSNIHFNISERHTGTTLMLMMLWQQRVYPLLSQTNMPPLILMQKFYVYLVGLVKGLTWSHMWHVTKLCMCTAVHVTSQ